MNPAPDSAGVPRATVSVPVLVTTIVPVVAAAGSPSRSRRLRHRVGRWHRLRLPPPLEPSALPRSGWSAVKSAGWPGWPSRRGRRNRLGRRGSRRRRSGTVAAVAAAAAAGRAQPQYAGYLPLVPFPPPEQPRPPAARPPESSSATGSTTGAASATGAASNATTTWSRFSKSSGAPPGSTPAQGRRPGLRPASGTAEALGAKSAPATGFPAGETALRIDIPNSARQQRLRHQIFGGVPQAHRVPDLVSQHREQAHLRCQPQPAASTSTTIERPVV